MALMCAICNNNTAEVVCHHCGKPLCKDERCRFRLKNDDAFSTPTTTFHCRECLKKYHPQISLHN